MHLRGLPNHFMERFFARPATKAVLLAMTFCSLGLVNGCGSGYHVIATTSGTAVTLNAGQTVQIPQPAPTATKWILTGSACSSTSCGTVVPSNDSVTYTAPPTVASQIHIVATTDDTTGKFDVTVNPALTVTATLDDAAVDTPYTATVSTSGGSNPARLTLASGSLPSGLQFNASSGVVSGTPTVDGDYPVTFQATDASAAPTATVLHRTLRVHRHRSQTYSVNITTSSLDSGTVNSAYNTQLTARGGTTPYTWTITSGSLPAGLALSQDGILSGNPTDTGTSGFTVQVTDSNGSSDSASLTLSILNSSAPATTLAISSPAAGTVGTPYTGTIGVSGGLAPYACSVANGSLPAGLVLNGCSLTGTPTTAGSYSLAITATDANSPSNSSTANITINIVAQGTKLTIGAPAAATVGAVYNSSISVSGGTGPYTCSITSGALPDGIVQNNCALTGTPTASGTFSLGINATDSSSPANSGSATISLVVKAAAGQLTLASPPVATVGKTYSGGIGIAGGTTPYVCSITSGTLPAGLSLNGCVLAGTPTTAGSYSLGVKVSDSSATTISTTGNIVVTVNAAAATLVLSSPAAATVGTTYNSSISVTGGAAPYTCSIISGTLPAGITQNNCTLTGTPSASGTFPIGIRATDSSSPANSGSRTLSLVVNAAAGQLTLSSPAAATVGKTYSGSIGVTGGTAPYMCSLANGTVPAGLTLNGCTLAGTATTAGSYTLGIKASDSSAAVISTISNIVVRVNAAPSITLTLSAPTAATVGTAYTGTIGVSGGTAPYSCSLTSGSLPAGIIQNNCTLTGTASASGTFALGIKATDSSSPANSGSATLSLVVNAAASVQLSLSPPLAATVGTAYTGTIGVSGGTGPYTCALASGTVPAGLTLNGCTLTGTPTTAGSTPLSIKASDSSSPANTTTANVTVIVNSSPSTITSGTPHINYTDLNVGSGTGGDNGNGVYVRIFGSHFGSSQGSSSVTLGGSLVTNCTLCSWSDTQIIAQLGSSATTGQIVVTVNGLQSNGMPFTVTPTTIVFVSPNGSDSNSGSFTSPFKTWRAAFNSVTSNDSRSPSQNTVIYLEPGTDVSFDDGRSYKAAISTDLGGTSATNQLSIVGYPGGTVNVGSSSITNGVHGWGKFVTIANLNIVGQSSAIDAEAGNIRIINNSLSCPAPPSGLGGTACVLGETEDPTETWVFQGNNVHDTGGNVDKTYHAVYFSSNVNHADVGWNNVGQNFKGYCRGIMFHATLGSNQFDLHIHDNTVTNSYCDGIALASVDPSQGTVEIYNNVVAHAALLLNPYGVANEAGIAINTDPAGSSSGNVEVYNNTVVDAGAYLLGNQNGCFGVVTSGAGMHLTNNICYQLLPTEPYIEKGSTNVSGSNNLWFGAGAAPTWDSAPITLDPLFLSTSLFSLQSQSPASGSGTTSIMSPFDIVGVPRGSRPSVGAYQ